MWLSISQSGPKTYGAILNEQNVGTNSSIGRDDKRKQHMRSTAYTSLKALEEMQLGRLDVESIQRIVDAIDEEYETVANEALAAIEIVNIQLEAGEVETLQLAKKKATQIKSRLESLDDRRVRYSDAIQKRIMNTRIEERLGSRRRRLLLEGFVMTLIVLVLGLLFYDFGAGPDETRPSLLKSGNIFIIDTICCLIFMCEFILRLSCAEDKKYVWRKHWIDFVTSIPVPGEAQLARFGRAARVARISRGLRVLRFLRVFLLVWRGMDKFQDAFDVKLMKKTLKWSVIITLVGALLVYYFEGKNGVLDAEGNPVGSYPEALWWSFTTVLTGGFGDIHNPATIAGQILTGGLVLMGMVLIGVFTATLTTLFVGEQSEEIEKLSQLISEQISDLSKKVDELADRAS